MSATSAVDVIQVGAALARWTTKSDGDFHDPEQMGEARRRSIVDRDWAWAEQQHSAGVVVVRGAAGNVGPCDALVSDSPDVALCIRTADCGSVALAGSNHFAAVHAGWMGLATGVIEETVAELRLRGATDLAAALGPCIHPASYEFSESDLDRLAARFDDSVRATTVDGKPSFDLPRAIRMTLQRIGVPLIHDADVCTSENADAYFSHRGRQEKERQALLVWKP